MGFDNARILLDSPSNTYYTGQTLNGRLIFSRDKVKKFRGIYVCMRGYCKVHWSKMEQNPNSRTDGDRYRAINHDSYEEYLNHKIYLAGSSSGDHQLPAGQHDLPFSIKIPDNCPTAFEGEHGYIRYELKVVVDKAFKTDQELMMSVRVIAPLDLNLVPNAREPIEMKLVDSYCCWCVSAGSSETTVRLPTTGYSSGQVMPVQVCCINRSTEEIDLKVTIKKEITYHARNVPGTKRVRCTLLEDKRGPVPPHVTRTWTVDIAVPEADVLNMRNCSFIDVDYELKITVSPNGCHDDSDDSCPLIFGTIPLGSAQPTQYPPAPTAQAYPPAITHQPYPAHHTYQPNQPFPTPNPGLSSYPVNPPVAPASPYPPNPVAHPPYPYHVAISPYPPIPPQSTALQTAPNPGPYPQPPYPTGPQTSETPPYPISPPGNPQYPITPPGNPQYPASPYPTYPIGGGLKTGTLGFVHGDDKMAVSIPLLPPGSVPMPQPDISANPYAASAPEPSTPDDVTKPLMEGGIDQSHSPPYNPSFANQKTD